MRKITVFCVLQFLSFAMVFAADVGQLPAPEFADTEVSTNFTFAVGEGSNRRLVFSLELAATPTNNVEIAVGCDADELQEIVKPRQQLRPCGGRPFVISYGEKGRTAKERAR